MKLFARINKIFKFLGPGLVTGVADDDPSGIATCSQTGAQFGFGQLWTPLFMLPLMIAVQEACARIGACKSRGIAYVIHYYYNKKLAFFLLSLLLIANTINIGADIGSMAAALQLIIPINFTVLVVGFLIFIISLQIFIKYKTYAKFLKWLCLIIFAYPITVIIVKAPLIETLKSTFIPHIEFSYQFLFLITGIFGTTISPYMFFWQASQEVEEDHERNLVSKKGRTRIKQTDITRIRIDNIIGMFISQIVTWSIIVVGATVLHQHGIHDVKNAAEAAKMLEPLVHNFPNAGLIAKVIFATGIIGLGLIAVPVLAGSSAYGLCEVLKLKQGFNLQFKTGTAFYMIMFGSMLIGILINYIGIDPFKALVYAAVINGVLAVPLIFMIAMIARNKSIMGKHKSGLLSEIFIWLTFLCMLISAVSMFATFGRK
ncbi:MAG: NRAMP family divalent metal transporter [Gammaproteobacteria bacterium]